MLFLYHMITYSQYIISDNTVYITQTLHQVFIGCRRSSWIGLAFITCATWTFTGSPPLPPSWPCMASRPDPTSDDPTWPVCLKSVGCPIMDRSILGLLWSCGVCSCTQDPNNWTQNSPAMMLQRRNKFSVFFSANLDDVWEECQHEAQISHNITERVSGQGSHQHYSSQNSPLDTVGL